MNAPKTYLQRLHIAAFGRFFDTTIGPFSPGLNVVYGANEAGKTTVNAFIEGVLFGWEDARGRKNVYKPSIANRSGTLFFADADDGSAYEISRIRNADGPAFEPVEASGLLETLDKETFDAMFSLTSDELRSLEGATDMAAKLLTAGSGTAVSPVAALADADKKIAAYTSRAASATESFVHLRAEEDECKQALAAARERSDSLKAEYREYTALAADRERRTDEVSSLNELIEQTASAKAEAARLERVAEEERCRMKECDGRLASLDGDEEGGLFSDEAAEGAAGAAVERLAEESARLARRVDAARDAFAAARAEAQEISEGAKGSSPRAVPVVFGALAAASLAALAYFAWSGEWAAAVASGAAAAMAALSLAWTLRMSRVAARPAQESAARQAMNRARAVLESCEEEELMLRLRIEEELASMGLQAAQGSLSQAQSMVAASRDRRQRVQARRAARDEVAHVRERSLESLRQACASRDALFARCGLEPSQGIAAFDQKEEALKARRLEAIEDMRGSDARLGELKQLLREGALSSEFDILKTRQAQIVTRKSESAEALAELLLARRALQRAADAWKSESVPAVYRRASELLALMTNGKWTQVRADETGAIVAVDAVHKRFEPRFLSTGTCQQLYLALRIALLERASDVGAGLPVLADDILVNFDDERRIGAVKALAQLAKTRQVVFFTCHKEILETVRRYAGECTTVAL